MQIIHSLNEIDSSPSVVTVGNFDGVHRGHRMILASVLDRARSLGVRSAAVTFDPHPAHVLFPGKRLPLITPLVHKLSLLAETGIDLVAVLPFNDLRLWSAAEFAETVLHNGLHAIEVHEGETFRFGHGAQASLADLTQIGRDLNFSVHACQPLIAREAAISSSRIRSIIALHRSHHQPCSVHRARPSQWRLHHHAQSRRRHISFHLPWTHQRREPSHLRCRLLRH